MKCECRLTGTLPGRLTRIWILTLFLVGIVPGSSQIEARSFAYVANTFSNTVSVIDTTTNTVIATIPVGLGPFDIAATPDGNRVYVTNQSSSTVSVIDAVTNTVVDTIPVGFGPTEILIVSPGLPVIPFAAFTARVEIRLGPEDNDDEFRIEADVTLGTDNNGIDPLNEEVSFGIGTFFITIPEGSFRRERQRPFRFAGAINGVNLTVEIQSLDRDRFGFRAEGDGADLTNTVNPVTVHLRIGNDGGNTSVTAEFR
jgi:YVTN family beta-propeller protein